MQIVIDIDDKTYADIKKGKIYSSIRDVPQEAVVSIANGTPLPKGHGRLIDADKLQKDMIKYGWKHPDSTVHEYVEDRPTIIEADGGE